jgi:tetratricopeptide (TPR) repeat protein
VLAADPKSGDAWMLKGELALNIDKDRKAAIDAFRKAVAAKPKLLGAHVAAVTTLFQEGDAAAATTQVAEMKKQSSPTTRAPSSSRPSWPSTPRTTRPRANTSARWCRRCPTTRWRCSWPARPNSAWARWPRPRPTWARRCSCRPTCRSRAHAGAGLPAHRPAAEGAGDARPAAGRQTRPRRAAAGGRSPPADGRHQAKAEQLYERASKLKPDDPRIRTALALSQFGKGKTDSAITELENIAGSDSGALADLALVSAHLRKKEVDKALKAIDALEKKQPDKPLAPMLRGRVLVLKKDIDGARAQFQKALTLDKVYFPAVAGLAALDLASNKPAEARKHFDDLIKADPDNVPAKQALAALLTRTGHTGDEVAKLLADAVKKNPNDVRAQLMLINFHLERRDAKQAIETARAASQTLVDHPDILMALGRAYLAANDMQQAVTIFNRLAVVQPKSPSPTWAWPMPAWR